MELFNSKEKNIEFQKYLLLEKETHTNHFIKLHNNSCSDKDFKNNIEDSKGCKPFKVNNLKHELKRIDEKYYIWFDKICFNFKEDSESNGIYVIDKKTNELIFHGFFDEKMWFRKKDTLILSMKYELTFLDE